MKQISGNQIIEIEPMIVDPSDSVPRGLVGWKYGTGVDGEGNPVLTDYSEYEDDQITDFDDTGETDTAEDKKLGAPTNLNVISEKLDFDANGNHVVTVTIEFDAADGAVKYDSKVSK